MMGLGQSTATEQQTQQVPTSKLETFSPKSLLKYLSCAHSTKGVLDFEGEEEVVVLWLTCCSLITARPIRFPKCANTYSATMCSYTQRQRQKNLVPAASKFAVDASCKCAQAETKRLATSKA